MRKTSWLFLALIVVSSPVWAQTVLPDPTIIDSAAAYSGYPASDAIDRGVGYQTTDYASSSGGTGTYLTFDFGAATLITQVYWADRVTSGGSNGTATCGNTDVVGSFDLIFSNDPTFTTNIATQSVSNPTSPAACGTTTFPINSGSGYVARYVKWQVTSTPNGGTNNGASDFLFYTTDTADLSVTKTDGVTTVSPGDPVTYTIVVTNSGPLSLGSETQTVTVGGGSGTFTLTFNGQTTSSLAFNATAATVQSALNALSSIGGVGGSVTVTQVGSVYTVTFGGTLAGANQPEMTASGSGGATVAVATTHEGNSQVSIVDTFPASLTSITYTANQTGGASGFTASGSGNISDLANMPAGSTITYTVQATVSQSATGTISNTATVSSTDANDPNNANDSATDTDTVIVPPTNVPTLDPRVLLLLAIALIAVATAVLKR